MKKLFDISPVICYMKYMISYMKLLETLFASRTYFRNYSTKFDTV